MVKIGKGLNRCPDCQVPKDLCYCARIVQVNNKTPVTIIMHQRERFLTSNTAVVAVRALKDSEILLRGMRDQSASEDIHLRSGHVPLVLYPSENALPIGSQELKDYLAGRPAQLIVPDGSWRQAKRVAKREEALKDVQAVTLSQAAPSLYRLRRQVKDGRLCTFEAIARALGDLESLDLEKELMKTLAAMDHAHAMARGMDKFDDGNPDPLTRRLFIGIRVGSSNNLIEKLKRERPEFDWVAPENFHLTLAFIGRLRRSQRDILLKALKKVRFDPFDLNFNHIDAFDDKSKPDVIWFAPKESNNIKALSIQVREIIDQMGIPFDKSKGFTPHWTLARTRGQLKDPKEISHWFSEQFEIQTKVNRVILFEGHGGKAPYEEVASFEALTPSINS